MWWRCLIYFGSCCLRVSFPLVVQPTGGSGAMAKMWGHHFNSVPIDHSIIAGCSWLTCWMCRPLDNVSNSFLICLLEILMWLRSPLFLTWVEQAEVSKVSPWTLSRCVQPEHFWFPVFLWVLPACSHILKGNVNVWAAWISSIEL